MNRKDFLPPPSLLAGSSWSQWMFAKRGLNSLYRHLSQTLNDWLFRQGWDQTYPYPESFRLLSPCSEKTDRPFPLCHQTPLTHRMDERFHSLLSDLLSFHASPFGCIGCNSLYFIYLIYTLYIIYAAILGYLLRTSSFGSSSWATHLTFE
jgi:hypothetical protein